MYQISIGQELFFKPGYLIGFTGASSLTAEKASISLRFFLQLCLLVAAKTLLDIRSIAHLRNFWKVNTQESYSNSLKQSNFLNKIYLENQTTDKIGEIILV